jgi:hypothetical protein
MRDLLRHGRTYVGRDTRVWTVWGTDRDSDFKAVRSESDSLTFPHNGEPQSLSCHTMSLEGTP